MKGQSSAMQFSRVKHARLSFCLLYLMYTICLLIRKPFHHIKCLYHFRKLGLNCSVYWDYFY